MLFRLTLGDGTCVALSIDLGSGAYELGIRPEAVNITKAPADAKAIAKVVEHLGDRTLVYAQLLDGTAITAQDSGRSQVAPGDEVHLSFDISQLHLFDSDGNGYHAH